MMQQLPKSIKDNLHFLIVEVDSQLATLSGYFTTLSSREARRVLDRSGYAYNLKQRIQNSCLAHLSGCKDLAKNRADDSSIIRGIELIATDLERITELCRDSIHYAESISDTNLIVGPCYKTMLARVRDGIELLEPAIQENDIQLALKIGRIESKLSRDYSKQLKRYTTALKQKKRTEDLINALFVAHSVEQMGDMLLTISESIISVNLGQPINLDRFHSLQASVGKLGDKSGDIADLKIDAIADTRSGSSISGISTPDNKDDEYAAIFKDGEKQKLKEERQGVESWHEIYPGLAPRILSYKKQGQSAAMLIEHLPGLTFEQILLQESPALVKETLQQLNRTLKSVWRETRTNKPISADFMHQLQRRLPDVYKIHPEFKRSGCHICATEIASFDTLVKQAAEYESRLAAPFAVYIHGDFNVDNIIYDQIEKRINFIDLHRSVYMDYVQDVSVFMVSNYRLQILDRPLRRRIMNIAGEFFTAAKRFAAKSGDETFEWRLALGLARSFATSTRFILDKSLSRSMFLRARYLIEQVLDTDYKKADQYKLPVKEIFVG